MDREQARETLDQLYSYSKDVAKFLNVQFVQRGRNSSGHFKNGMPCGAIMHYTASNAAYSKRRPYGRYPVMRERFARGGRQGVGVHFIVWDCLIPRFAEFQKRYPLLSSMPAEVAFMGDDLAFWHAGSANRWSYGIEVRNCGRLYRSSAGQFFWGKSAYHGRPPIKVGDSYWEPYTREQMEATLWVNRLMCSVHIIRPERFLGHTHVSSTRIDPGPHFPIHEMRRYSIQEQDVRPEEIEFLREFDTDPDISVRNDSMVSEFALHAGLYRNDWDGRPEDWDELHVSPELHWKASAANAKEILQSLGYYITDDTLADTVAVFRSRWKERRPNGRGFRNKIPTAGGLDKRALELLSAMASRWDRM